MFICWYLLKEEMFLLRTPDLPLAQHYAMPLVAVQKRKETTVEKACSDRMMGGLIR